MSKSWGGILTVPPSFSYQLAPLTPSGSGRWADIPSMPVRYPYSAAPPIGAPTWPPPGAFTASYAYSTQKNRGQYPKIALA